MTNDHGPPQLSNEKPNEDNSKLKKERKRKFVGFSERVEEKRKEREDNARSWIERKFVIAIVLGIAGYAWYVYIGRFCVPMLRRDDNAMGGLGMGGA